MNPATASHRRAAIVVAGGSARRMGGVDKVALEVGGRTLLDRVLAAVAPLCDEVVVVGPTRPTAVPGVIFTVEEVAGGGPVPAVAAGLAAIEASATVLLLAADLPLLTTAHLRLLLDALAGSSFEAATAVDDRGRHHPLLAAHRGPSLGARLDDLGPGLAGLAAARLLPTATVSVDLGAEATRNVNRPADLDAVRALVGAGT